MAGAKLRNVVSHLSSLVAGQQCRATPDQELLARFLEQRDKAAFAALMERHGGMVLGVCQRVLRNAHDAEDACQAVFLVLARKARSVRKWGSLGSWLHGVAWRTSHKLRAAQARRRTRETCAAAEKPAVSEPADISWRDVQRLLDEELSRLPAIYRAPLVLCHLEGRTQDEAARELGWTGGTLRGRLERGRDKLRARLTRRGITGSTALAVAALVPSVTSATVPPTLVVATVNASLAIAAGKTLPVAVPATVSALTGEVLQAALLTKLTISTGVGLAIAVLGLVSIWSAGLWSTPGDTLRAQGPHPVQYGRLEVANSHVWCVAFSPDGKRIAAGRGGVLPTKGELRLLAAATGKVLFALQTPFSVRCVVFAPDGKTLATAEHDGMARLREAATGKVLFTLRGHRANIDAVAFSADGKTVATSSWDRTVKLWDTATGLELRTLTGHSAMLFCVAFGSNGMLATGCADGTAKIWQADTGAALFTLRGHHGAVHWLAFSPNGKLVATASWDKTVKLWDTAGGKQLATLYGHTDPVLAVAFSPDGSTLASSSGIWGNAQVVPKVPSPGEVILWDLNGRKARARMRRPDRVFGLDFSPDSKTLAMAGWDGAVSLWNSGPAALNADPSDLGDLKFAPAINFAAAARNRDAAVAGPRLKKEYAEDFQHALKVNAGEIPGLVIYGPDAPQCVKYEPDGLRITLPPGYPRPRPGTGVVTDFGIKGDFEITLSFDILQEPELAWTGKQTDLSLVVVPNEPAEPEVWHKANQNRASISRQSAGPRNESQILTCSTKWNEASVKDKWGNEIFANKDGLTNHEFFSEAKTGRLRLERRGSVLYFYAGEGVDQDFTLLHQHEFGEKDLKNVRILASTRGPGATLDVRVTDLRIRADGFARESAAKPQRLEGMEWLAIALAILGVVGLSLGACLYVRRRRAAPGKQDHGADRPGNGEAALSLAFQCPGCRQRLKTKTELAGKTTRCPKCGATIHIPKDPP